MQDAHAHPRSLALSQVVTKVNLHDDGGMAALVRRMAPARWKIFQVGQGPFGAAAAPLAPVRPPR